ncbi:hypothetical protein RQP53_21475 [Paucibacter sp. APW11]|uniref:MalT-like TPR region domain-containing protein n=1 Tax=Roseateles aquae TaxID=3077235 RepID=A0ABU3PH20_9BURK|nr:hypothetical protein [Paucibacter sp. APW11]MDT9001862.1 hypothetical protein [Paucibacter sp. APW11]
MELFVSNETLQRWERQLAAGPLPAETQALRVALCWQLRQRDSQRCLLLARALLVELPAAERRARARVRLAAAEAAALLEEGAAPVQRLDELRELALEFRALQDGAGEADVHYLHSWLAWLLGRVAEQDALLARSADLARETGDAARLDVAEATLAFSQALRDPVAARQRWSTRFEQGRPHPAAAAWVMEVRGTLAAELDSDYGRAAGLRIQAFELATGMGQMRTAIMAALNLVDGLNNLNDPEAAQPWAERALALARQSGWPTALARALLVSGETLRHLQRFDAALAQMNEGLDLLDGGLQGSRLYAVGLRYLGQLRLDRDEHAQALPVFERLHRIAEQLGQADLRINAQRGLALALSALGRAAQAEVAAQAALRIALDSGHALRQIEALGALADLHLRHRLPAPAGVDGQPAMHYLRQALQRAEAIAGYVLPVALLRALAEAHEAEGDAAGAYAWLLRANAAQRLLQREEASQRAVAAEVLSQTERAHAEAQRQRQLAEEQQRRTQLVQAQSERLQDLVAMGRALTAELQLPALLSLLRQQLQSWFAPRAVQLLRPSSSSSSEAPGWQALLSPDELPWQDAAWQALLEQACREGQPLQQQDRLIGPLQLHGRLLALLLLQTAERPDALLLSLFDSLCAYAAIALDNAGSYASLREAQDRLVAQEKHAQLGSLVAGVAGQIHAPALQCLTLAEALQADTAALAQALAEQRLRQSELQAHLARVPVQTAHMLAALDQASELVQRFKQLAEPSAD